MGAAEAADLDQLRHRQWLVEIGVDMIDDRLHCALLLGEGVRAEDIVVEGHCRLVSDRGGSAWRTRPLDEAQAAIGKVIDGRRLQPEHGA